MSLYQRHHFGFAQPVFSLKKTMPDGRQRAWFGTLGFEIRWQFLVAEQVLQIRSFADQIDLVATDQNLGR